MTEAPTRLRPPPVYSSAAGEEAIRQLYAKALGALPFPHDQLLVDTPSFGTVHVVVCGDPSAPPLVLWHGTASPAPFALLSFQPLVARFRVYAPDLPCQGACRELDAQFGVAGVRTWGRRKQVPELRVLKHDSVVCVCSWLRGGERLQVLQAVYCRSGGLGLKSRVGLVPPQQELLGNVLMFTAVLASTR